MKEKVITNSDVTFDLAFNFSVMNSYYGLYSEAALNILFTAVTPVNHFRIHDLATAIPTCNYS